MGGGGSEGIPGEPPKSEILIQWIHAFAAAVAKAFLTSVDSIGFQSEVSPAGRGSGDREVIAISQ
jgi:hypothetical protein